jgi:hypothetical protein
VRVLVGRIDGGINLFSWREAKTIKLGGSFVGTIVKYPNDRMGKWGRFQMMCLCVGYTFQLTWWNT